MNPVVEYMLHLVTERRRIIEKLAEQETVFTCLIEPAISDLRIENVVVVSSDWRGSLVSMRQPSDTLTMSTSIQDPDQKDV